MIQYQLKKIEEAVPVKVICNKSGKEVNLEEDDYIGANLMHSFEVHFGYGSDFDMETWKFDLAEEALLEFVKTFKVRPFGFAEEADNPDKVFEEWKTTGKFNW